MAERHPFRAAPTNEEARRSRTGLYRPGKRVASYGDVDRHSDFARAAHTDHGCRITVKMLQVAGAEMVSHKPCVCACGIFRGALQVRQLRAMCELPECHYPNRRKGRRRCA